MKIIIVDDELLVRIGIKSCIEWEKHGMEVVGEASDGLEALRQINLLEPDVILLDIKMPNMDGIELMHKIKEENIKCKILILSGFDDLYHVKEAMKLGAVDYLHKPCMSPKDILDILLNIKAQIEKERHYGKIEGASQGSLEKSRYLLKESFLRELVESAPVDEGEFEQKCGEYGLKLAGGNYNCLVFTVKNLPAVTKRYKDGNINILQSAISNIMSGILAKENGAEFFTFDRNVFAVIVSSVGVISDKRIVEGVNLIADVILDAMKQFLNVAIVMGISDIHRSCGGLKQAFEEAAAAMKHRFYLEDRCIIRYSEVKRCEDKETLQLIDALIEKMKDYLSKHDFHRFDSTLQNLVNFLMAEPCLSGEDVKKIFNVFLFLIRQGKAALREMEMLSDCETLHQLYNTWKEIVKEKLSDARDTDIYKNCSYLVKRILNFIDENYDKEISLNLLSGKFNVSPNYISRLFKEETGETLFNYLNSVRIEQAKTLLRDTDLKIYEVGFKVGFNSTVHFNIVFNKLAGVSPKQFKDSLLP